MKIALAQQNYIVGDFEGNLGKILKGIDEAASKVLISSFFLN
jgi:predicted amidohydrolase